jgi:hypothetical protein
MLVSILDTPNYENRLFMIFLIRHTVNNVVNSEFGLVDDIYNIKCKTYLYNFI